MASGFFDDVVDGLAAHGAGWPPAEFQEPAGIEPGDGAPPHAPGCPCWPGTAPN